MTSKLSKPTHRMDKGMDKGMELELELDKLGKLDILGSYTLRILRSLKKIESSFHRS
jgi:hypothetical protein